MSRYELRVGVYRDTLFDNEERRTMSSEEVADLLNQQDDKIKELENKVFELNTKLNLKEHEPAFCKLAGKDCEFMGRIKKLDYENQKLFEDLYCEPNNKRLAIKELEDVYNLYEPYENENGDVLLEKNGISFIEYLDQRIKDLKGEK